MPIDGTSLVNVRSGTGCTNVGAIGQPQNVSTTMSCISMAIAAAPAGGGIYFPAGNYSINSPIQITASKPLSLIGAGSASQIYQTAQTNLIVMDGSSNTQGLNGITIANLYLGSASSQPTTSLIALKNTHRSTISNVRILGGYYGLHLQGALLNNVNGLLTGSNFNTFFTSALSTNVHWVYGERYNNISSNANTFISPVLEGGTNGITLSDTNGEGSINILGGTIEGVTGVGLTLTNVTLPSSIIGTHFEQNGSSQTTPTDIQLNNSSRVSMASLIATHRIAIASSAQTLPDCLDSAVSNSNTISNTLVNTISIDKCSRRTVLSNITYNIGGMGSITDLAADTEYKAVTDVNPYGWFGTEGIGRRNPNSNPSGLTPNLKLDVNGQVRANSYATGDIYFYKGQKLVQRIFEDEDGLYLENQSTKQVSRIFTESDIKPLQQQVDLLTDMVKRLTNNPQKASQ